MPYLFMSFLLIIAKILVDIIKGNFNNILPDMWAVFIQALYGSDSNLNKTIMNIQQIGTIWFLLALFWALLIVKLFIKRK